jgi:hypothetical protein
MDYLREDCGEVLGDLFLEGFGQALPELFGPHVHLAGRFSFARVISSSIASRVSLLTVFVDGCAARLVADTGSLSCMRCRYTTKT